MSNWGVGLVLAIGCTTAAQADTFTWQGKLVESGVEADGVFDLKFRLFDAAAGPAQVGSELVVDDVLVSNGLLTVDLDFGTGAFTGDNRWMEIDVKADAAGAYTTLGPRQPIHPTPYALHALSVADTAVPFVFNGANAVFTGGDVGIGTLAPTAKLDVRTASGVGIYVENTAGVGIAEGIRVNTFSPDGRAIVGTASGGTNQTAIYGETAGFDGWAGYFIGRGYFASDLGVGTDTPAERLHVVGNAVMTGNLGVGTTTPSARVEVQQNGGTAVYVEQTGAGVAEGIRANTFSPDAKAIVGAASGGGNQTAIYGETAGTSGWAGFFLGRGHFSSDVGIGTTSPSARLDVRRNGGTAVYVEQTGAGAAEGIRANTFSPDAKAIVGTASGGGNQTAIYGETAGFAGWAGFFSGRGHFAGDVGIGTTNPSQRLDVSGNVKASGWFGSDAIHPVTMRVNDRQALRLEAPSTTLLESFGFIPSVLGGYEGNETLPKEGDGTPLVIGGVIGGGGFLGEENLVVDHFGTVGGGAGNVAGDITGQVSGNWWTTVGGGINNAARDFAATVVGGWENVASGPYSFVGGGETNAALETRATVVGGGFNQAGGVYSTVGGGELNNATGGWSTVPGGQNNLASGDWSFAAGRRAKANHAGSFVWGDSQNADFTSTATNQFLIRADGGVGIGTASPSAILHLRNLEPDISIKMRASGSWTAELKQTDSSILSLANGGQDRFFILPNGRVGIGTSSATSKLHVDGDSRVNGSIFVGASTPDLTITNDSISADTTLSIDSGNSLNISCPGTLDLQGAVVNISGLNSLGILGSNGGFTLGVNGTAAKTGGGSWSVLSDARLKRDVGKLDGALERLLKLRGVTFRYDNPDMPLYAPGQQIGMIAQEVEQVFPEWVDELENGYKSLTFRGFEALVVEALRDLQESNDQQLADRDHEIAELRQANADLQSRLEQVEALMTHLLKSTEQ